MTFFNRIMFNAWSLLTLFVLVDLSTCVADEYSQPKPIDNISLSIENKSFVSKINILPINPTLFSLMDELSETHLNKNKIDTLLAQLTLSKASLNAAEQYLFLVAQTLVKKRINFNYSAKNISDGNRLKGLVEADKLSSQISENQLAEPHFFQLHLLLAEHYANQGKYDLAYIEKKYYLQKYYLYQKNKRIKIISSLDQSFEVKDKKANNALLKSQNALKVRRVAEVKSKQATQQYNFTFIIITSIIFVLLFFRQLIIRNKLIRLTLTDTLTELPNRSALFEYGNRMVNNFTNKPEDLSILLLDLDYFKIINDKFGHNTGDKVLIIVAQLVKETMRSRDVFARLGGEEFVALLPYADIHKAKAIAMRINDKISKYDFSSVMRQSTVTISIGLVTMGDNKMSFDNLLNCSDLAMYQAKKKGRNTVVCYQSIHAE